MFHLDSFFERTACVSYPGRRVTYGELDTIAKRIAGCVESRRLVFCLCSNTVGSIAGYVAFMGNNDVPLLLDKGMAKESFDNLVRVYHPQYVWAPARCGLVDDGYEEILKAEGYVLYGCKERIDVSLNDNLALLLATSGSTGSPKMVRLSKENLRSNALSIIDFLRITERERPILGLPMNYAYGLSIVNSHLMAGATLLLTEHSLAEREFWRFANDNGFTSFSGVPFAFETIDKLRIGEQELPTLRTVTQAGGAMDRDLISKMERNLTRRGVRFYVMYGQAEATARISYLEPERIKDKLGSVGREIPGGTLALVDEQGEEIADADTVGELLYRGPNVSLGYAYCAADLKRGDDNRGIVRTGDLAYRDADGFYFIVGRKSRFVKPFGIRISLDHLEELTNTLLSNCACAGDDRGVVVYTTDREYDKEAVIDLLSSRTKIPRKVFTLRHVDMIPRTSAGKVIYNEL